MFMLTPPAPRDHSLLRACRRLWKDEPAGAPVAMRSSACPAASAVDPPMAAHAAVTNTIERRLLIISIPSHFRRFHPMGAGSSDPHWPKAIRRGAGGLYSRVGWADDQRDRSSAPPAALPRNRPDPRAACKPIRPRRRTG